MSDAAIRVKLREKDAYSSMTWRRRSKTSNTNGSACQTRSVFQLANTRRSAPSRRRGRPGTIVNLDHAHIDSLSHCSLPAPPRATRRTSGSRHFSFRVRVCLPLLPPGLRLRSAILPPARCSAARFGPHSRDRTHAHHRDGATVITERKDRKFHAASRSISRRGGLGQFCDSGETVMAIDTPLIMPGVAVSGTAPGRSRLGCARR